ncbi:transposase [Escherichia coli]|nr:transposase [Escherichia coli]
MSLVANSFCSIDDARVWINRFVNWYNFEHKHSGIKSVTPAGRHQGNDMKILAARKAVCLPVRELHCSGQVILATVLQ